MTIRSGRLALVALLAACSGGAPVPATSPAPSAGPSSAPGAPRIVQPGAPGQATRTVDATNLSELGGVSWVQADVDFMQGMIPHHAQALQMTELARRSTRNPAVRSMALRMEISQRDEIGLMRGWLARRELDVPESAGLVDPDVLRRSVDQLGGEHAAHMDHGGMAMMPGMLTGEQMQRLAHSRDGAFDRLFLQYMIQHHGGAVVMVDRLFATDGAGQESEIFQFASHVSADQRAEIDRMTALLDSLPPTP